MISKASLEWIDFSHHSLLFDGDPIERSKTFFTGIAYGYDKHDEELDEEPETKKLGWINGCLIDIGYEPGEEVDIYEALDRHAALAGFVELFEPGNQYTEAVHLAMMNEEDPGHDNMPDGLLLIDEIYIEPKFRGLNFSKTIIDQAIRWYKGEAHIAALLAIPSQDPARDKRNRELQKTLNVISFADAKPEVAENKLIRRFENCGFNSLQGNRKLMVRDVTSNASLEYLKSTLKGIKPN